MEYLIGINQNYCEVVESSRIKYLIKINYNLLATMYVTEGRLRCYNMLFGNLKTFLKQALFKINLSCFKVHVA